MSRFLLVILMNVSFLAGIQAQSPVDSLGAPARDTLQRDSLVPTVPLRPGPRSTDSVSRRPVTRSQWSNEPGWGSNLIKQVADHHPYFGFNTVPVKKLTPEIRQVKGKEMTFYLVIFILLLYALLRNAFARYFSDLFRLFFRTTIKQRQIREQMMQTPLPSILLNAFFVLSAGLYITFLLQYFKMDPVHNFWLLWFYCCAGLSVAYFVKFIGLKVSGWVFNMRDAADAYIFIVFIVNKMIGILLVPFLVILAFGVGAFYSIAMTLSWCMIGGLIIYRFILTYAAVRNQVKVNPFHFFLYLCAFEIAPLLLIYKGLLLFFQQSA